MRRYRSSAHDLAPIDARMKGTGVDNGRGTRAHPQTLAWNLSVISAHHHLRFSSLFSFALFSMSSQVQKKGKGKGKGKGKETEKEKRTEKGSEEPKPAPVSPHTLPHAHPRPFVRTCERLTRMPVEEEVVESAEESGGQHRCVDPGMHRRE